MEKEDSERPAPAPYPSTDREENDAVDLLEYILDHRVKSHIGSRDKTPNHDGWLELVNESHEPIGRINVQVKKLPGKHRDDPKRRMKTKHLAYCFVSRVPFIVILVDTEDEIAYWTPITERWYYDECLYEQKSKTVKLGNKNVISRTDVEYVDKWDKLIKYQDFPFIKLDRPERGVVNWGHRVNQNFVEIEKAVSELGSELDVSVSGNYEQMEKGKNNWGIPVNNNFESIERDVCVLAKEVDIQRIGGYSKPGKGSDGWDIHMNYNFFKIEEDIERIADRIPDIYR